MAATYVVVVDAVLVLISKVETLADTEDVEGDMDGGGDEVGVLFRLLKGEFRGRGFDVTSTLKSPLT